MPAKISFDSPIQSGDQSFDRVLHTGVPVAALFWSGSKLDSELESELNVRARADAGKLLVVRIKMDDNPELVRRYDLGATSTLITFREGAELARVYNPIAAALRQQIDYLLGRAPRPAEEARL